MAVLEFKFIWSTPATAMASGPGSRNVADVTSLPSRIVVVSREQVVVGRALLRLGEDP